MLLVDVPIQRRRIAVRRAAEVAQQPRLSGRRRVGDALVLHQRELLKHKTMDEKNSNDSF